MAATMSGGAKDDDRFFAIVAKELSIGKKDPGLWAMALTLDSDNGCKTLARYIRLRVEGFRQIVKQKNLPATCSQPSDSQMGTASPPHLTGTLHAKKKLSELPRQCRQTKSFGERNPTRKTFFREARHVPSIAPPKTGLRRIRPPKMPVIVHPAAIPIASLASTSPAPDMYLPTPDHAREKWNAYYGA